MSNTISEFDYFMIGRKGMGKVNLVKLLAYLHGINFKYCDSDKNLSETVKELSIGTTLISANIVCSKVNCEGDI